MQRSEIQSQLNKTEAQLLQEWYEAVTQAEVGGRPEDLVSKRGDLQSLFRQWSQDNLNETVCRDWNYCAKRKQYGKTVELVAQLGDFLGSALKAPVEPFTLSVLLVMHGFDLFCECEED